ncbi:MAG: hypothetical protein ACKON9_12705 [Planctomycetaceae bacterium]
MLPDDGQSGSRPDVLVIIPDVGFAGNTGQGELLPERFWRG